MPSRPTSPWIGQTPCKPPSGGFAFQRTRAAVDGEQGAVGGGDPGDGLDDVAAEFVADCVRGVAGHGAGRGRGPRLDVRNQIAVGEAVQDP